MGVLERAEVAVIGGGVIGTSIAYHLAEAGWTEVVLVERAELTSGSTFHSAGLVGQLRSSVTLTRMMMYGVELYRGLAAATGVDPSWHEVGSLREELNWHGNFSDLGTAPLAAGRHVVTIRSVTGGWHAGSGAAPDSYGPAALSAVDAREPVETVTPADARSLCGRRLDWVEALR